jgi:NAD-dependent histone deacetylase SIR2
MDQTIMKCDCDKKGLIKPDIIFFGEQLPASFAKACELMEEADLVIVMGTSLVVFPFAYLLEIVDDKVPIVLINNTDSRKDKKRINSLWLDGNLDERIKALAEDLKWEL